MKEMWCRNLESEKENFFFEKKTGSLVWTRNTGEGNVNFSEAKEDSERKCSVALWGNSMISFQSWIRQLSLAFMSLNCNSWCLCSLCLHDMLTFIEKRFLWCFFLRRQAWRCCVEGSLWEIGKALLRRRCHGPPRDWQWDSGVAPRELVVRTVGILALLGNGRIKTFMIKQMSIFLRVVRWCW